METGVAVYSPSISALGLLSGQTRERQKQFEEERETETEGEEERAGAGGQDWGLAA